MAKGLDERERQRETRWENRGTEGESAGSTGSLIGTFAR